MSATISEATGKPYGIQRVCDTWEMPRSSFYTRKSRRLESPVPQKRGPKTLVTDAELLALIRDDLATSLFTGEGHRKVWGRIRFVKGIKVGRKRVLRIMREEKLLLPHRVVQGGKQEHKGKIITTVPNDMWGTDGTKIFTVDDGWCWLFTAIEHWNAECVGWHLTKTGDRFAALQPISMAVNQRFGSVGKDAARGLTLRMDNGSQYLSEHFQNQIKFWGIAPSFAFVSQPQTNGVAERFNKTLKEQIIYGRTYRNIEELRIAVTVLDNHSAHISKETMKYLATRPGRFEYVHTPKHGSWLNLVECAFSEMARSFLRHIRVTSKEELKERILKGIADINEAPVPFRWKKFDLELT